MVHEHTLRAHWELVALVDPVSEDVAQTGNLLPTIFQQRDSAMAVLNVGRMNMDPESRPFISVTICRLRP